MNRDHTYEIACDPTTAPDVLAALGKGSDRYLRKRVACNPSTPPETLISLSTRNDSYAVQLGLGLNPSTPYGIWIQRWRVIP